MLLDIGAKTSNLLFFEQGKVYSRGINIGANSITQDFAAESKQKFADAERIKIEQGFVSLGGAYEEPDNPHQAAISKIARQVMTRLHIQVNQTIQFYRGQQGGSAPNRLFLAGGASVMPYTAQFFAEKLSLPVEYFNPFRNIQIDPTIDLEELAKVAHAFGEVVGLGLRNAAQCPVEMNLMPKSSLKRQQFNQKKPYFIATVVSLVAGFFAYGGFYARVTDLKQQAIDQISENATPLQAKESELQAEERKLSQLKQELGELTAWADQKSYWADVLVELRQLLMRAEQIRKESMGIENGVWIESFTSLTAAGQYAVDPTTGWSTQPQPGGSVYGPFSDAPAQGTPWGYEDPRDAPGAAYVPSNPDLAAQFSQDQYAQQFPADPGMDPAMAAQYGMAPDPGVAPEPTNLVSVIHVMFRGMNLKKYSVTANDELAYAVEKQLRASPLFDSEGTKLSGMIEKVGETNAVTFSFEATLKLRNPMKL